MHVGDMWRIPRTADVEKGFRNREYPEIRQKQIKPYEKNSWKQFFCEKIRLYLFYTLNYTTILNSIEKLQKRKCLRKAQRNQVKQTRGPRAFYRSPDNQKQTVQSEKKATRMTEFK